MMGRFNIVYFAKPIGMAGPIKIGCSSHPADRIQSLMVWSPFPLELLVTVPGSLKLEANLHDCFLDAHLHHEWFQPVPLLLAGIAALQANKPLEEAFDLSARIGSLRGTYRKGRGRSPKGRTWKWPAGSKGSRTPWHKEARQLHAVGELSQSEIASRFGVSRQYIHQILRKAPTPQHIEAAE